jgi:hypothetical protein
VEQARQIARADLVEQNLPGLSVAVGAGGEIVWAEGFGYADLEERVPVRPNTRFRIGTASTALTSAAVGHPGFPGPGWRVCRKERTSRRFRPAEKCLVRLRGRSDMERPVKSAGSLNNFESSIEGGRGGYRDG